MKNENIKEAFQLGFDRKLQEIKNGQNKSCDNSHVYPQTPEIEAYKAGCQYAELIDETCKQSYLSYYNEWFDNK